MGWNARSESPKQNYLSWRNVGQKSASTAVHCSNSDSTSRHFNGIYQHDQVSIEHTSRYAVRFIRSIDGMCAFWSGSNSHTRNDKKCFINEKKTPFGWIKQAFYMYKYFPSRWFICSIHLKAAFYFPCSLFSSSNPPNKSFRIHMQFSIQQRLIRVVKCFVHVRVNFDVIVVNIVKMMAHLSLLREYHPTTKKIIVPLEMTTHEWGWER